MHVFLRRVATAVRFGTLVFLSSPLFAREPADSVRILPPIEVSASRIPDTVTSANHTVDLFRPLEARPARTSSLMEALLMQSTADITARGAGGVQADISMRGSAPGQTLIMFEGIPLSDPQTSHHDLDVPFPASAVDHVELLQGAGSYAYGANAFGGTVNIIARPAATHGGWIECMGGADNTFGGNVSVITPTSPHGDLSAALTYKRSDGFRDGMDYSIVESFARNVWRHDDGGNIALTVAAANKTFGAYDFYSGPGSNVPSTEHTQSYLAALTAKFVMADLTIAPRVSFRAHNDRFTLYSTKPDLYVNDHHDYTVEGEVVGAMRTEDNYSLTWGINGAQDALDSKGLGTIPSGLGSHTVTRGALFASGTNHAGLITRDAALRIDLNSLDAPEISGSVALGVHPSDNAQFYINLGNAHRIPNFTERFYVDPYNRGSVALKPEHSVTFEVGTHITSGMWLAGASVFHRQSRDLIDWVRTQPFDTVSIATNITSSVTQGAEISLSTSQTACNLPLFRIAYAYLETTLDLPDVAQARYALNHPRNQVTLAAVAALPAAFTCTASAQYRVRLNGDRAFLLDASLAHDLFTGQSSRAYIRLDLTNALNEPYVDIPGVPTPGRKFLVALGWEPGVF